ncbi:MAG: DUF4314 domain-containing protein [Bacteroidales bacterium]|nr:DUF4314 domain-containing protein [Bacteroidales bacterium]
MTDYERLHKQALEYRKIFTPGTRIILTKALKAPHIIIPAGTKGTVNHVDNISQIHTSWDTGSTVAIIPDEDSFRKLTDLELDAEKTEYAKSHMMFYIGEECASGMEFKTKEDFFNALSESIDEAAERGQKWFTVTIERENDSFLKIRDIAEYDANNPKPVQRCNRCHSPVITSDTPGYKYQCLECDEDLYEIETYIGEPMTEEEFNNICEALGL